MLKYVNTDIVFQEFPDEVTLAINLSNCPCHCPGCHSSYLWEGRRTAADPSLHRRFPTRCGACATHLRWIDGGRRRARGCRCGGQLYTCETPTTESRLVHRADHNLAIHRQKALRLHQGGALSPSFGRARQSPYQPTHVPHHTIWYSRHHLPLLEVMPFLCHVFTRCSYLCQRQFTVR